MVCGPIQRDNPQTLVRGFSTIQAHKPCSVSYRAWFVCLYGEIIPSFSEGIIDHTGTQTMLYLTCTMISSVDLAHYGVFCAKDWVSVYCLECTEVTISFVLILIFDQGVSSQKNALFGSAQKH